MSTVVVMEQDGAMRTLICEWLEAAGYEAASAAVPGNDSHVNLAIVDLVIVDIPSLKSQGTQTVREIQARHPGASIIGMSTQLGTSLPSTSALAAHLGLVRLLAKPLAREELLAATVDAIGPGTPA
jgi:DNA-binding response OmpR family regulator